MFPQALRVSVVDGHSALLAGFSAGAVVVRFVRLAASSVCSSGGLWSRWAYPLGLLVWHMKCLRTCPFPRLFFLPFFLGGPAYTWWTRSPSPFGTGRNFWKGLYDRLRYS